LRLTVLFIIFIFSHILLADDNQKITLQLLWKHQFEFAGFYMAKEKGYYKQHNIDLEFKEYNFGIDIVKDVQDGVSTFGLSYPSIVLDRSNGSKVVLLNSILQSSPHVLVSLKSSNIKTIEDFKDKKIMLGGDAIKTASFSSILNSNSMSFKNMDILPHSFNIDDLIDGKTDIISVYLSNEIYKLQEKGLDYNIWDPKDYGFDFYDDILFTSQKLIDSNPKLVENFQQASLKGWRYAFENIDETVEVILKKYNSQNKSKEHLKYEAQILKKLAFYNTTKLGEIKESKIQRIYDIYNILAHLCH